jgi:hypothetical protein
MLAIGLNWAAQYDEPFAIKCPVHVFDFVGPAAKKSRRSALGHLKAIAATRV